MKTKVTKTKAQRILTAMRKETNHGKTASEIAAAADVDHNHVYIFEGLVASGHLKRNGGDGRQLEGFERKFKGGRGVTYAPGRNFEVPLPVRVTAVRKPAKSTKKTGGKKSTGTKRTPKAVAAEPTIDLNDPALAGAQAPAEGNAVTADLGDIIGGTAA